DEFIDLVSFLSELGKEGEYKVPRERYVRRWRVADANGVVGGLLRRSGVNPTMLASDRINWVPTYSKVNGDLGLDGLGISKGFQSELSIVHFEVEVTQAGEIGMRVNDPAGLQMWLGEETIDLSPGEGLVESTTGTKIFSIVIDRKLRKTPLRVELLDGSGRVRPVGGL
ncbi:MAG: hypothetical protein ACI9UA_002401, partial [Pseudoalteromonas tetraodonis]